MSKLKLIKKTINTFYHYQQVSRFNYIIDSYHVHISPNTTCTCRYSKTHSFCEHIFYIYLFKFKFKIRDLHRFKTRFNQHEFTRLFYKQKRQRRHRSSRCSICLDDIKSNHHPSCHQCRHIFHRMCYDRWIVQTIRDGREPRCPLCRTNILYN